jgi:Tol biopolymer transport system component
MSTRTLAAAAAVGLALTAGADGAEAALPGANGRIAFAVQEWRRADPCLPTPHGCEPDLVSSRIETVLQDGRGRRVLRAFQPPDGIAIDSALAWSPNGRLLAFDRAGRLATIRSDGTGLRQLPQLRITDREPTWSPDGRRLAFIGEDTCLYCSRLYSVRPDGTGLRRLMPYGARWPSWSSTGALTFTNYNDQSMSRVGLLDGLYTARPDGSRLRQVFRRYWGVGVQPDWSPDGRRIAFGARKHIFTIGARGRGLDRVTGPRRASATSTDPAWSPDGRRIAFLREGDIYVIRSDGRGIRRIVDAPSEDLAHPERPWLTLSGPGWQPLSR